MMKVGGAMGAGGGWGHLEWRPELPIWVKTQLLRAAIADGVMEAIPAGKAMKCTMWVARDGNPKSGEGYLMEYPDTIASLHRKYGVVSADGTVFLHVELPAAAPAPATSPAPAAPAPVPPVPPVAAAAAPTSVPPVAATTDAALSLSVASSPRGALYCALLCVAGCPGIDLTSPIPPDCAAPVVTGTTAVAAVLPMPVSWPHST